MDQNRVKLTNLSIGARLVEPKYHIATVSIEKDGVEVKFSLPVVEPDGDICAMYDDVAKFLEQAAKEVAAFSDSCRKDRT